MAERAKLSCNPVNHVNGARVTPALDHLPLRGAPADPALLLRDQAIDFAGIEAMTGRIAAMLRARALPAGSRVASWLPKGLAACVLPLATARAGHIYVPVNPLLKRAQLAHILEDCEAALLVLPEARAGQLAADDLPIDCAIIHEAEIEAVGRDSNVSPLPPGNAAPDDLCQLLYTSGSTGRPKGVMLSHANLMIGARSAATYLRLAPQDRVLGVLPLSFDYGQNQLFSSWWAGASVAPLDYLLPRDVIKAVERHGITTLAGVPPLWVQLTELDWPDETARRLARLTNSGGALTRPLVARLRETFPAADVYAMYGLTEAFRSTFLPPDQLAEHPESVGWEIPDAEVLVVGADGHTTAPGEVGEIVHAGPLVAQGYWRDAARTAERFRPAPAASRYGGVAVWSGDRGRRDEAGRLFILGREDAMIKSAGNRISPAEIEEAALVVSGVAEAVALGRPDMRMGQAIVLLVRPVPGTSHDELEGRLRSSLRGDLPNFMQPAELILLEDLPRNPNGKIDHAALRATYAKAAP
jgi:acyl-CoA ligase (AMP-forming) (exosortase A-associated)